MRNAQCRNAKSTVSLCLGSEHRAWHWPRAFSIWHLAFSIDKALFAAVTLLRVQRLIALAVGLGAYAVLMALAPQTPPRAPRPNIVIIQADDLGYGDLSAYGQAHFRTPAIDRLAAEGMRFTQYYAGSTVCAPSRTALIPLSVISLRLSVLAGLWDRLHRAGCRGAGVTGGPRLGERSRGIYPFSLCAYPHNTPRPALESRIGVE